MTHEQLGNCRSRAGAELATPLFFGPRGKSTRHGSHLTHCPLPQPPARQTRVREQRHGTALAA